MEYFKNIREDKNSLNLFRLLACLEVLVGHVSVHLGLSMPKIIDCPLNLFIGVPIFFILSGFLIWKSLENTPDFKRYFSKRILRLYPELWVCLFVEILSIVLFYKEYVPISDYMLFTFTQGTIFQFWTPDSLRGYGCGTPNGSLWTITVIVQFYIFIYLMRQWLNKANKRTWIFILLMTIFIGVCSSISSKQMPAILGKLFMQTLLPYAWLFFVGVFIQKFKNRILSHLIEYWWLYFMLYIVDVYFSMDLYVAKYPVIGCVLLAMCMIGFAYRYPNINTGKDISYGVYIYHMIFVNIAVTWGYLNSWIAFVTVIVITFVVAYSSTIIVGEYGRRLRSQLS